VSDVLFYHLERARLGTVLPGLLEKTLERGWRALVLSGDADRLEAMDDHLWTFRDDSFLPHGTSDEAGLNPVLLSADEEASLEGRQIVFLTNGAEFAADKLSALERCVTIFDGGDEDAVARARAFWKAAADNGHEVTYWRQNENGQWKKQN